MALISQADLETKLGRSLTTEEQNIFPTINTALQYYIERMIGSGVESVEASSRYYDGGVQHLTVEPCTSITAVAYVDDDETVENTLDTSDYVAEPRNRTTKTYIRHRNYFSTGINNIKVTAKFSIYEDTDMLNLVKDAMLNALESEVSNSDNIKKESIEGYSIEFATTEAKNSLAKLKYLFPGV